MHAQILLLVTKCIPPKGFCYICNDSSILKLSSNCHKTSSDQGSGLLKYLFLSLLAACLLQLPQLTLPAISSRWPLEFRRATSFASQNTTLHRATAIIIIFLANVILLALCPPQLQQQLDDSTSFNCAFCRFPPALQRLADAYGYLCGAADNRRTNAITSSPFCLLIFVVVVFVVVVILVAHISEWMLTLCC